MVVTVETVMNKFHEEGDEDTIRPVNVKKIQRKIRKLVKSLYTNTPTQTLNPKKRN
jgi:hypothetical protein